MKSQQEKIKECLDQWLVGYNVPPHVIVCIKDAIIISIQEVEENRRRCRAILKEWEQT